MRIVAFIQAILLLTTSLIPEGRVLLGGHEACAGECGCSAESRREGTCCCSSAKQSPSADCNASGKASKSCCSAASEDKSSAVTNYCCSKSASPRSCCSSKGGGNSKRQPSPRWGVISTCGCGEYAATSILHAPRTVVSGVRVQGSHDRIEACLIFDQRCNAERPAPATPPPKSSSC